MSTLKENTISVSAIIASGLTVGPDGVATLADDCIEKTLPEGITMDTVKAVNEHRDTFVAALTDAVVTKGHEAMKKNNGLTEVSLETKFHKDSVGVNVYRTRESRNPANGEKIVTPGAVSNRYVARGAQPVGQLKIVRQRARELFADLAK